MNKFYDKAKEEFLALLPPTIYFFFTLGLVAVSLQTGVSLGEWQELADFGLSTATMI